MKLYIYLICHASIIINTIKKVQSSIVHKIQLFKKIKVKLESKDSLDERISEHWQQSESDSRSSSEEKELRFEHRLSKTRFENEFIDDKTENRMTKEVYRVMEVMVEC